MPAKKTARKAAKKAANSTANYQPAANDHLSAAFDALKMIPPRFRGSDQFLDVISWNIRYFNYRDPQRVRQIADVLKVLNGDILVLQEIDFGAMEPVIEILEQEGAGFYEVAYGTTGGNQRVALLWDYEWVRAKDDVAELFGKGEVVTPAGQDAFPRLPLYAYFTALTNDVNSDPFTFQMVGLHLKSQMGGGDMQRRLAADWLAHWLKHEAPFTDADAMMFGDWNKEPGAPEWEAIHEMERNGEVLFEKINDSTDFSHLYYKNKSNLGSRLDLALVTMAAGEAIESGSNVVRWTTLDDFLSTNPSAAAIKALLKEIREKVSDHMPVVARFYFTDQD